MYRRRASPVITNEPTARRVPGDRRHRSMLPRRAPTELTTWHRPMRAPFKTFDRSPVMGAIAAESCQTREQGPSWFTVVLYRLLSVVQLSSPAPAQNLPTTPVRIGPS
jgi:hypothetical protein